MALRVLAASVACIALLAQARRFPSSRAGSLFDDPSVELIATGPLEGHGYCCCKDKPCRLQSVSDSGDIEAVYSPNQNMCCKMKKRKCNHWMQTFSGYRVKPPTENYCNVATPQDLPFVQVADPEPPAPSPPPVYDPGTVGYTVDNYCNFTHHVEFGGDDEGEEAAARNKVVSQIVEQLDENSIDQMAKSMFSIYLCVRWAPTGEYQALAEGEMAANQIEEKSVLKHYEDFSFMPLKCSENMHVYDTAKELNQTFFEQFEAQMNSLSDWFVHEQDEAMATRLRNLHKARDQRKQAQVEELSVAFDLPTVRDAADSCSDPNNGKVLVNVQTATSAELLADCAGLKWWLTKLSDWHRSMPFSIFMTPDNLENDAKPKSEEQVILCFGKRVASQLHRRQSGDHLMTDQSSVGCHGFYDFTLASTMVQRIIRLWRPPTCQLSAMELEFKVKILEMMEDMNDALFDALPSMIMEETTQDNFDGTKLQPAGAVGTLAGMWKAITERFNFFQKTYTRLGKLLGETTVKWAVCPLNKITDQEELDTLDRSLGTEDLTARYYSKIANSRHTGETDLPGEKCEMEVPNLSRAMGCAMGQMRENMPEPYADEDFLCPVVPLLPAKAQLEIFKKKDSECMLHMGLSQLSASHWYHRGHTPTQKQYNVTENEPSADYQAVRIVSSRSAVDDKFNIYRTFVKFGVGCTEHENEITPRWCGAPTIFNDGLSDRNLLTNLPIPGSQGEGISNDGASNRIQSWLYRTVKGFEHSIRRVQTEWAGRASTRYEKLLAKSFVESEESDLLHALTFQKKLGDLGGDQTGRETYERYAVKVPCTGFEPERLFELKNTWAEYGYQLARKGKKDFDEGNALSHSRAFHVDLRGEAFLHVKDERNQYLSYYTHLRAFAVGREPNEWRKTDNPVMTQLSGSLNPVLAANLKATHVRGFRATFACGTKRQMHDLPVDEFSSEDPNLPASFAECVRDGITINQQLEEENPSAIFLPEQVVVRMTIHDLSSCFKQVDESLVDNVNETQNHVFSNFIEATAECQEIGEVPEVLQDLTSASSYRGMLLGKGTPPDTLQEVLMDPQGFVDEVGF